MCYLWYFYTNEPRAFFFWMGLRILVTADGQILINRKHSSSCCLVPPEHFQRFFSNWQPPVSQSSFLLFWQMGCNTHLPRLIIVDLSEPRHRRTLAVNTSDWKMTCKISSVGVFSPLAPQNSLGAAISSGKIKWQEMVQSEGWVCRVCIGTSISVLFFGFFLF